MKRITLAIALSVGSLSMLAACSSKGGGGGSSSTASNCTTANGTAGTLSGSGASSICLATNSGVQTCTVPGTNQVGAFGQSTGQCGMIQTNSGGICTVMVNSVLETCRTNLNYGIGQYANGGVWQNGQYITRPLPGLAVQQQPVFVEYPQDVVYVENIRQGGFNRGGFGRRGVFGFGGRGENGFHHQVVRGSGAQVGGGSHHSR